MLLNCRPARREAEIKGRRDAIEASRIDGLKESLDAVLFQERLFRLFCEKLDRFREDREGNESERSTMNS